MFVNLRGGVQQQLEVCHLGYRNDQFREYDEVFLNDHSCSMSGFLEESHPLYRIVIQNEAWDDSIAADLVTTRKC